MVKSLTFTNCFGRSLRCILREPERIGIAITEVTGLGPGSSDINIHEIATADGGYFGSARYSSRTIALTLRLCDGYVDGKYLSIEEIRHLAYEFFATKTRLQIVVETDSRSLVIIGVTETDDPVIFSKAETISVSIKCPDYYFKMVSDTGSNQSALIYGGGLFQFPFSNESLDKSLIQFGELETIQTQEVYYDGDSETGFELEILFNGQQVTSLSIQNKPLGNSEKGPIGFAAPEDAAQAIYLWRDDTLVSKYLSLDLSTVATKLGNRYSNPIYSAGNRIVISSKTGKKRAVLIDDQDNQYNIIHAFEHLDWLKLYPGYNEFKIVTDATSLGHFSVSASFEALYAGV